MPSQNWYKQNNLRAPVAGQDYVLLGNLIDTDPGGPQDTAAALIDSWVKWKNAWAQGTYYQNDMVRDLEWTMIANKQTTDRARPTTEQSHWLLEDSPSWTPRTATGISWTGFDLTFGQQSAEVNGWRAWIPDVSVDMFYSFYALDITDPANEILLMSQNILLPGSPGWASVTIPNALYVPNQVIRFALMSVKAAADSSWSHVWTYDGTGGGSSKGNYRREDDHTELRIAEIDKDDVNRASSLASLKQGDELRLVEEQSSRWDEYTVTYNAGTAGSGDDIYYMIGVLRTANGTAIRSGKDVTFNATIKAAPQPSPYVELTNYWFDNPPFEGANIRGWASDDYPPTVFDNNAYGVDMLAAGLTFSPDWDIVNFSG